MNFYKLSADVSNKYISVEKRLNESGEKQINCLECGAPHYEINNTKDVQLLLFEKGRIFPDCMLIGYGSLLRLFSGKAIQVFQEAGLLNNLEIVKAELIAKPELKVPISEENKYYYFVNAKGHAEFDYERMGLKPTSYCSVCGMPKVEKWPTSFKYTYLKEGSWDGNQFFLYNYCTENVLKAVYKNKLTGFTFQDLLISRDVFNLDKINLKNFFR